MSEEKPSVANLSSHLRLARKNAGLSQARLGEIVGVAQRTVGRWEKGKGAPDVRELLAICDATEKTWGYFVPEAGGDSARVPAPTAPALLVSGEDYFGDAETMTLRILPDTAIRPGAGGDGFAQVDLGEIVELVIFKQFIHDLLGFWPPDTMEGLRIMGHSMQPTFRDGQLILVDPVEGLAQMINLRRYVLTIQDLRTGDWRPLAKRIVTRPGGGFKIVSDNRAYGEDDMLVVPRSDEPGRLFDHATGQEIRMRVHSEILWPRDEDDQVRLQAATDALEELISEGALQAARQR